MAKAALIVKALILDVPKRRQMAFRGRVGWALQELIKAGEQGVAPINHPGPRWSSYVHRLRSMGLNIKTSYERHGGAFPGNHAVYKLLSRLILLDPITSQDELPSDNTDDLPRDMIEEFERTIEAIRSIRPHDETE